MTSNRFAGRGIVSKRQISHKGTNSNCEHDESIVRHEEQPEQLELVQVEEGVDRRGVGGLT